MVILKTKFSLKVILIFNYNYDPETKEALIQGYHFDSPGPTKSRKVRLYVKTI